LLESVNQWIQHSVGQWGYLAVFLLMLLESANIPIPSEVTMLVGGLLASQGKLNFWVVGLAGTAGNLVGSWASYALGRTGGRALILRYGRYVRLREKELDHSERWFARYGDSAVFFSRLLPVVRTFISLPAGIAEMPLGRFTIYTTLGCLPWTFALTWTGLLLGDHWESVLGYFHDATAVIVVAAVVLVGLLVWRSHRRRNPRK